ncbi:hypothetical protein HYDPIDRAFT_108535 [Hydnomerulius pinastri MD-312]|nr:hypothetical protein HYDPIDRAFT_108535 [Hydnomerulius pinastri MD-312]
MPPIFTSPMSTRPVSPDVASDSEYNNSTSDVDWGRQRGCPLDGTRSRALRYNQVRIPIPRGLYGLFPILMVRRVAYSLYTSRGGCGGYDTYTLKVAVLRYRSLRDQTCERIRSLYPRSAFSLSPARSSPRRPPKRKGMKGKGRNAKKISVLASAIGNGRGLFYEYLLAEVKVSKNKGTCRKDLRGHSAPAGGERCMRPVLIDFKFRAGSYVAEKATSSFQILCPLHAGSLQ